jgi:hypothetical protein
LAASSPTPTSWQGRDGAAPSLPLSTTCRRRLAPRTADKAARLGLDLSLACRRRPRIARVWPCRRQDAAAFLRRPWERQAAEAWALPSQAAPWVAAPVGALRPALVPGPLVSALPLPASSLRPFSLARRVSRLASSPLRASQALCEPRSCARQACVPRLSCAPGPFSWRWSSSLPPAWRSRGGWSCVHSFSCSLSVSSHSFS